MIGSSVSDIFGDKKGRSAKNGSAAMGKNVLLQRGS